MWADLSLLHQSLCKEALQQRSEAGGIDDHD
jgi:hypothetical protein